MSDRKIVKISDLGVVITGNTPSSNDPGNYGDYMPFIKATDIDENRKYTYITEEGYSYSSYLKYRKSLIPKHSTCVVTIGSIGKKMTMTPCDCFVNQAINAIIPHSHFDKDYVYYVVKGIVHHLKVLDSGTTSGRENVSKRAFSNMRLMIIDDINKQSQIGHILSAYDDLIENNLARISLLEKMASELYKEWFIRRKKTDWKTVRLKDFGYVVESGSRPKGGVDKSLKDGIPSLGAESIDSLGQFDYTNVKYVSDEFYSSMRKGHGKNNDILLYKDGAYIGKVTLFRDNFPFKEYAVNEHVFILRCSDSRYQNYLYFTLNLPQYFVLMQNLNRNAAQPGLTQNDLDSIKLTLPDEDTIERFNALISPILTQVFTLAKEIPFLTKQRDLLLPRLMSGKLSVEPLLADTA
ncbi:MAG: restriction endonuclease subunit S [Methanocorpusculum sp.]|nr:restriction endonuclease subunit S [Methanocorpusculum sp.]